MVAGRYAYVADGWNGLQVIDVIKPSDPVLVGEGITTGFAVAVAVGGDYAWVADY